MYVSMTRAAELLADVVLIRLRLAGRTWRTAYRHKGLALVMLVASFVMLVAASCGPANASPTTPTPDPSDTACYRGAIYCPPPIYGLGQSPTCQYVLGRWVTPFGRDCASGAAWRRSAALGCILGPDCVDDVHMCAPGNVEGVPPGCFDAGGVLVAD